MNKRIKLNVHEYVSHRYDSMERYRNALCTFNLVRISTGLIRKLSKSHNAKIKNNTVTYTAQKVKFSIKDFFSKCDQIRSFQRIWSHLLRKSLMENSIFCAVTPFFLSTFRALYVGIFYFCISRPSNFSSLKCSYYIMLWSVKCTFTCQGWYF